MEKELIELLKEFIGFLEMKVEDEFEEEVSDDEFVEEPEVVEDEEYAAMIDAISQGG